MNRDRHPLLHLLLVDRRRSWIGWAIALVLVIGLIAVSYGAIEGDTAFEDSFGDMPDSVKVLLGIDDPLLTLTSPAGYLNSQLFANFLPILLTVFAVGLGARIVAGDERDGTLELLLAHPLPRARLALERLAGAALLLLGLGVVSGLTLLASGPPFGLDVGVGAMTAATATSVLLALLHGAVAYAAGAATGSKGAAIAAGAGLTVGGFLLQSLATLSSALRPLKWASPWQWFLDDPAILSGWSAVVVPGIGTLACCAVVVAAGTWRFGRRDLGHG